MLSGWWQVRAAAANPLAVAGGQSPQHQMALQATSIGPVEAQPHPCEPELVSSCGFHSMQLNTQFLGRFINSGTIPREFRALAWDHRCVQANKILLEQSAKEHSTGTVQWLYKEPAQVSQGQI